MTDEKKRLTLGELEFPGSWETLPYLAKYILESLRKAGLLEGRLENGVWKHRVPPAAYQDMKDPAEGLKGWQGKVVAHLISEPTLKAVVDNFGEMVDFLKASLQKDN